MAKRNEETSLLELKINNSHFLFICFLTTKSVFAKQIMQINCNEPKCLSRAKMKLEALVFK